MAEAIVTDRSQRPENRQEIWRSICAIAEMHKMTPNEYIAKVLKDTKDFDFLDLDAIDWAALFRD